jgi:hypothetical protein
MMFKMTELKYEPNPVLERRWTCSSSCTPTTSRTAAPTRCAASAARTPIRTSRGRRRRRAVRAAARRRQRAGAADAQGDRLQGPGPGVRRARQSGRVPADGLRPPRLQELRPARQDPQEDGRRGARGHRHAARCSTWHGAGAHRARGRLLRQPQALPERGLLLGHHLPGDGLPGGHVPGALRHPARGRVAGAVAGDAGRPGPEDRAAAAGLHRLRRALLRASSSS